MKVSTQSVLVTGGCGFIGTWVLKELGRIGARVVVLDAAAPTERWKRVLGSQADRVELICGSLLDREKLARIFELYAVSNIIHLAALLTPDCQKDPWEGCRVNVLGTVALFEQIRKNPTPIQGMSYASSVAVFGDEPDHATGASDASQPLTFYGAFKRSTELIAEQYFRQFGICSMGVRPQVAYGPEREVGLTAGPSLAARAAARGEPYAIGYTGNVGYDYVEDVAAAFVRGCLETPKGAIITDLAGPVAGIEQVVESIEKAVPEAVSKITFCGPRVPAHSPPNPNYISTVFPDWKTTSLDEGMSKTVRFYR